jgi:pyridoxine kinase
LARIVAVSSFVARGHVGLRALLPGLEALGHDVAALPSVVLSSHAGQTHVARLPVATSDLAAMVDALAATGWLRSASMLVSGYLPTPAHVAFAADLAARMKALDPQFRYVCDPVLGDWPKGLYLPPETAAAITQRLIPLADLLTPNAFELAHLTGDIVDTPSAAAAAARRLDRPAVVTTSVPAANGRLATVLVEGQTAIATSVESLASVPHGTGDLLTGLLAGFVANGAPMPVALSEAGALLASCIDQSRGSDDLAIAGLLGRAEGPVPLSIETIR